MSAFINKNEIFHMRHFAGTMVECEATQSSGVHKNTVVVKILNWWKIPRIDKDHTYTIQKRDLY